MNALERLIAARGETAPAAVPSERVKTALERILEQTGKTIEDLRSEAAVDAANYTPQNKIKEVPRSREFERIKFLPRRAVDSGAELVEALTDALRTPWGKQTLRPIQALALHDIHQYHGMLGPIRVGAGKTLITYLAPELVGAKKPLLLVPAALKKKTRRDFHILAQHWMGPHPDVYKIESYEKLGRVKAGDQLDEKGDTIEKGFLEKFAPDVLILDEAHKVKNRKAAVTRRIRRYIERNPNVIVIAMSGTIIRNSLKDFAHIAKWCLPNTCPVPTEHKDLEAWSGAIDKKPSEGHRVRPGALVDFCTNDEARAAHSEGDEALSAVRTAFRRRLVETPGVIATQEGPLDMSLSIRELAPKREDDAMDDHFDTLRTTWETPTGIPISDGITFKRHALEMALGFEYMWDPSAPEDWLLVRRAWAKFCRDIVQHNRRGIDSELQAKQAVRKGIYDDGGLLAEWEAIAPTFEPNTVPVWFSDEAVNTCAAWASDNGGIIFTDHTAFAERLAKATKLPYYGRQGMTDAGLYIEDHPKNKPLIASRASNSTGRNLQYGWSSALVVCPPGNGLAWEQMLGRIHRDGQESDEVTFDVYIACKENAADYANALVESRMQEDTTGQAQKLCYATCTVPDPFEINARLGARWG